MRVTAPINFTFSDDSAFLKKNLGGGHRCSEFACLYGSNTLVGKRELICLLSFTFEYVVSVRRGFLFL